MASLNDFKKLNIKCQKIFELTQIEGALPKTLAIDDTNKKRFGFYYLVIQNLLELDDFASVTNIITDQDFNSKVYNIRYKDEGIDAIYIDEENKTISLFNFKFSPKWNVDQEQSIDKSIISSKYLNVLHSENNTLQGKLRTFTDAIIEKNNSDDAWDTILYIVSNENKELDYNTPELKDLRNVYGIETRCIGLDTIVEMTSLHPSPISTQIIIPNESILSYSEDNISTDKSFVLSVRLTDLIRMTSDDEALRNNTSLEDDLKLYEANIEMNVLYENVRGYIVKSKFNHNILKTLKEEPSKFYFYNNGLTIVADDIIAVNINRIKSGN